jgi:nucleotide-binding universal stress UspA family protein
MTAQKIPEIRKILYATDLSETARHAFAYAVSLANGYGAGVTILHVLGDTSSYRDSLVMNIIGEDKWKELRKANEQQAVEIIRARLQEFCEDVSAQMPACPFITEEIVVKIGHPVEEIVEMAEKGDFDLVIMGAHGHGILEDAMIGSTSRRVLRRCKKPVLVIRLPQSPSRP